MEKLIELLNEFEKSMGSEVSGWTNKEGKPRNIIIPHGLLTDNVIELMMISKSYGFIKWLVDNDKIDQTNKFLVSVNVENTKNGMGYTKAFEGYESLLMLLAISETPIDDLISYLK